MKREVGSIVRAKDHLAQPFGSASAYLALLAAEVGDRLALVDRDVQLTYRQLEERLSWAAAAFQRAGLGPGAAVGLCAGNSVEFAVAYLGALRAGLVVVPLPATLPAEALEAMLADCGAEALVADAAGAEALASLIGRGEVRFLELGGLAAERGLPAPVEVDPATPANITYSSGTTGVPKGVVQPHSMRWTHLGLGRMMLGEAPVMMISTPMYSTGGSVSLFMTLGAGGTAVIMGKFDPRQFLEMAQTYRATHAILVPVQYRRILDDPEFARFDLSSFKATFSNAAPCPADLKREVLRRWPGGLIEFYSMTEGGAATVLLAHERPDKLHTVGRATTPDIDIRIIDEEGRELPVGEVGEIVGRSGTMMSEYFNKPGLTQQVLWRDGEGRAFIRSGDLGRLDEEGFLTIVGRKKDVIISGGLNIYSEDLEQVLTQHPDVAEAAIVAAPSERWGETPFAFVEARSGARIDEGAVLAWANARLGRTQRISDLKVIDELPRNAMGKVLKRELRGVLGTESSAA